MRHYFISQEHESGDYFNINHNFDGKNFVFKSCSDVFSKNQVDYGSLVLIKTVIENKEIFSGNYLDMCCGYGPIGIILSKYLEGRFSFADVNNTATQLAEENCKKNGVNAEKVYTSDMFASVDDNFNHIFSNPPIKTGKSKLFEFIDGSFEHLHNNAHIANSMRTRSAPVSITNLSSFTSTMTPVIPPMVVTLSPFFREDRISSASFFRLFSGRISMK